MTSSVYSEHSRMNIGDAIVAVGLVAVAAVLGQIAILPNLTWYHSLIPPAFAPPDWLFGAAWTTMYAMMAYASWRVLSLMELSPDRSIALLLYLGALLFNISWPFAFFAAHSASLGFVDILPQWLLLIATISAFVRLDATAGVFMVPVFLWVSFAAALNFEIWRLNG